MEKKSPLLIVLTPVRNEAWVLRAFLEATSLWADYIIIADQMSTDGSREIAKSFPKVILIENDRQEMHQAATRRLLFEASRKITGDKILFTLDADEFLSGDFIHTEDWQKILNSEPNDAFCWRWMNLKKGDAHFYSTAPSFYWAVHESEDMWNGEFPDYFIHEWRLPWPPNARKYDIDGFCSIHLARMNPRRQQNKERFYQVATLACRPTANPVKLYRQYHEEENLVYFPTPENAFSFYEQNGIDVWHLTDLEDDGQYYSDEVMKYFDSFGTKRFATLDIWDSEWMSKNGITDPRNGFQICIQKYLCKTTNRSKNLIIRIVDKLLSQVYR